MFISERASIYAQQGRWSPTLDYSLPSLPLRSVAVKRGSSPTFGVMRLRIEYFDQNERFAALLPREGVVVSKPRCADSALGWYLVRLDARLSYDGTECSHFLVASRWQGQSISERAATSVFILLVPSTATALVADGFSHKQFALVAWGMAHVVAAEQALGGDAWKPTRASS